MKTKGIKQEVVEVDVSPLNFLIDLLFDKVEVVVLF